MTTNDLVLVLVARNKHSLTDYHIHKSIKKT